MTESQTDRLIALSGLGARAEIRVDRWGLPHIKADSLEDLFFAQGANAARDRLWQIDLWRKRGLGRLAASFGPGFLEQDKASRAFLYRGDMAAEWASYGEDAQMICTRFAEGVNAWIEAIEAGDAPLPPEFALTGSKPEKWAPEDVVRIRSHALTRNALSEVLRAQVMAKADARTDLMRQELEPAADPDPPGAPVEEIPLAVLDLFRLATAPVTFAEGRLDAPLAAAARWRKVDELQGVIEDSTFTGSNNWAVSGARTASGRPILAGDPHRAHALPSLRYLVHLTAPGLDVIGAGEPCVPGISMGHNGFGAFALTISGADQEDIYVYDLDGARYRGPDGWTEFERVEEVFEIKGEAPQTAILEFTAHGPVLLKDVASGRAFALRSVWWEPGTAAYMGGLSTMRARSVEDWREALERFRAPSLNHVWSDADGSIAWQVSGLTPIRSHDGLLPARGDGSQEWQGFHPLSSLPAMTNPAKGFVHSANQYNLPDDFDFKSVQIGFEWHESSRADRIAEVLGADDAHTLDASRALQTDVVSRVARRLGALAAALPADTPGRALFQDWDGALSAGSAPALLCEFWYTRHLKPALFALLAPEVPPAFFAPGDPGGILAALETPDARFGADPVAARDALLSRTLAAAHAQLVERFDDDEAAWEWGALHRGYFEHPLSGHPQGPGERWDVGPVVKGGGLNSVMMAAYRPTDFRVMWGASVRFVIDVGEWDASVCINAPGQSGDPACEHYGDLAPLWARGDYVPFLYSDAAVEAAVETRLALSPKG